MILKKVKKYKGPSSAIFAIAITYSVMIVMTVLCGQLSVPDSVSSDFLTWFTYVFPVFRLGDFIIGCNIGYLFLNSCEKDINTKAKTSIETFKYTFMELFTILMIIVSMKHRANQIQLFHVQWFHSTLLWLPTSSAFIFLFSKKKGIVSKLLNRSKVLCWVGNLSSFTFLIHPYCIEMVKSMQQNSRLQKLFAMFVAFLLTHIIAYFYNEVIAKRIT